MELYDSNLLYELDNGEFIKYDMDNEFYREYVTGLCKSGKDVPFYDYKIRNLRVSEIFDMSEYLYNKMIAPFSMNNKLLFDKDVNEFGVLDVLKTPEYISHLPYVLEYIKLVLGLNENQISLFEPDRKHLEIVIDNKFFITKEKFEELRKIILFMNFRSELKRENLKDKDIEFQNESDKKRFEKLFKARNKKKLKEQKAGTFSNIYDAAIHIQNNVDYEKCLNWSVYQLFNTLKNLNAKEMYLFNMNLYSSGMCDLKKVELPVFFKEISKS